MDENKTQKLERLHRELDELSAEIDRTLHNIMIVLAIAILAAIAKYL